MLPPNTDRLMFSELSRITGEYLPRIAGAKDAARKRLLCKLACQIFDISTEPRAALFKSPEDLSAFQFELDTCLSRMVMPLLDRVRMSEEEVEAIQIAVAGRRQHWLGVVVARSALAEIPPAGPSGTETDQSLAIRVGKSGGAEAVSDPIAKQRRQLVDDYIEECRQAGVRIIRVDIWKAAKYKTRSEFERWERNDSRATETAGRYIMRVLTEKPHLKEAVSKKPAQKKPTTW
jgi:hypothetical protein